MTNSYRVKLADGSTITVEDVARVEKDGSGRRFYGEDGEVLAAFDDGQSVGHYPAGATVEMPPAEEPEE